MGQTQGGSAGNLELLEKIKEQQAEIEALKEVKKNLITVIENEFYSIESIFSYTKSGICFLYITFFVNSVPEIGKTMCSDLPIPQQDFIVRTSANNSNIMLDTYLTPNGTLAVSIGEAGRRYFVNIIYPIKNIQED